MWVLVDSAEKIVIFFDEGSRDRHVLMAFFEDVVTGGSMHRSLLSLSTA